MFYLKEFFFLIFKLRLKGAVFLCLTFILMLFVLQEHYVKHKIARSTEIVQALPYFFILVQDNIQKIDWASKLIRIPGVQNFEWQNREKLKKQVTQSFDEMGVSVPSSLLNMNFQMGKVYLDEKSAGPTSEMIREYLDRLLGSDNVIFSQINNENNKNSQIKLWVSHYRVWIYPVALIVIFLFWIIVFFLVQPSLINIVILMESYQRRRAIGFKINLLGLGMLYFFAILISFFWRNQISLISSLLLFGAILFISNLSMYFGRKNVRC